ncbi:hypothetical protein, partial [Novosphingobium arvoryzae]|uniref:hypothetical protein n=1 Tax=Novosphingobium arvoryzae TaxID=1256514 RepID=UPI001E35FEA9
CATKGRTKDRTRSRVHKFRKSLQTERHPQKKVEWPAWWATHLRRKPRRQSGEPRIATVNYRTSGEW